MEVMPRHTRWARALMLVDAGWRSSVCSSSTPCSRSSGAGCGRAGRSNVSPLTEAIGDPALHDIAWFTVWQAAAVDRCSTLAIGLPAAYVLTRGSGLRGRIH